MDNQILFKKLKNNTITNDELIFGLNSEKHNIIGLAVLEVIERKYSDENIIIRLVQLSSLLSDNKLFGIYQIGHIAIAALFLIGDDEVIFKFNELYGKLSENDKFITDNFIREHTQTYV
jgi:hypothetical protein